MWGSGVWEYIKMIGWICGVGVWYVKLFGDNMVSIESLM